MHFEILLAFCFSSLILTLSPGPDIIYVATQGLTKGRKEAILISFGLTTGLIFHTILVVSGFSFVVKENETLYNILKFFGAGYFIYLAFQTFFKREKDLEIKIDKKINYNYFKRGLIMNLLNPKVSLFFIALFPGFIFHDQFSIEIQFFILGLIFWFQATIIFILVSIFSSKSSFLNRSYTVKSKTYVLEILIYIFFSVWILKP